MFKSAQPGVRLRDFNRCITVTGLIHATLNEAVSMTFSTVASCLEGKKY